MPNNNLKRFHITITGSVQGVGFRPTVFRYAVELNLNGHVKNTNSGVIIEIEGPFENLCEFINKLYLYPPPLAKIDRFNVIHIPLKESKTFTIKESSSDGDKSVSILPDIATCKDCLDDIKDANNRRFRYPFTNCTHCGPRYSIIKDRPYDRNKTSMEKFELCPDCKQEFENPLDRRFHAQPNACSVCGPKLKLLGVDSNSSEDIIEQSLKLFAGGRIGAIKGIGGFNIACDPHNFKAVQRLREVKSRPHKAFALMTKDLSTIKKIAYISETELSCLNSIESPIVLLRKINNNYDHISPDNNYLGLMLPYTPLHHLLFDKIQYLVMTSANRADEPIAITDSEIQNFIEDGIIDFAITHNRDIIHRSDDSIVQIVNNKMQILRRSRGFVPTSFSIDFANKKDALALGGQLKNTFAIRKNNEITLSQHIGDLSEARNYQYQESQIADLANLLEAKPNEIICDAHPGYETYSDTHIKVYHHYAHALSVVGEHGLFGTPLTALVCDGTGFGTDEKIWGFEFLAINTASANHFKRTAHLKYYPLPGGEKAIKEVDRIAISLMNESKLIDEISKTKISATRTDQIKSLLTKRINCPECSSLGRLFDGIAAMLGLANNIEYEAQAAMLLQKHAENFNQKETERYNVQIELCNKSDSYIIEYSTLISGIIADLKNNLSKEEISFKFHLWIVDSIIATLKKLEVHRLVFSGGCFQNKLLTELLISALQKERITYFTNEEIPPNDAGIAFGQAMV